MVTLAELFRRLRATWFRRREEREMEEELRFHLEMATEENLRRGLPAAEARRQAALVFGGAERFKEEIRDARGAGLLEDVARDVRYALRSLARHRAYTVSTLITLSLGIGATTAVFGVVSGVVLRPLPFPDPERLVQMYGSSRLMPERDAVGSLGEYREQSRSFESLAGYEVSGRYLRLPGRVERVRTVRAERDFFAMLGAAPLQGRVFGRDDPAEVAVVSEAFWRSRLGADRPPIGRTIALGDRTFTVVGVMPESFQFPYAAASLLPGVAAGQRTDLWIPLDPPLTPRGRIMNVTGRLKPGVSEREAESELEVIARRLAAADPQRSAGRGVYLVPLEEAVVAAPVRRALGLLLGAVLLVLALACANVTNLSLARALHRSREVAVRSAIGAGRGRLVRQFLTESLVLSLAGGAIGLLVAWWGSRLMLEVAGPLLPRAHEVDVDWRVFAFLLSSCALVGLLVGLMPALIVSRGNTTAVLKAAGGQSTIGIGPRRLRDALVVAEVALAFVLAAAATLLVRELGRLRDAEVGFVASGVLTAHLGRVSAFDSAVPPFDEIAERVARLPGVQAAGFTQLLPLQSWGWSSNSIDFTVDGRPPESDEFPIELRYVTSGYFEALGIPVRGRSFTPADDADAPDAIMVNEALARRYFGDADPVGARSSRGTIVGVVRDVPQEHLDRPATPEIYFPVAQNWSQLAELGMTLVVRGTMSQRTLLEQLRPLVRGVDADMAIFSVKTMDEVVADSVAELTLYLALVALLAGLALVLSTTGTYGVITFVAGTRAREFATRTALGASAAGVARLVLGHALRLALAGIGAGVLVVIAAAPLLPGLPASSAIPELLAAGPAASVVGVIAVAACLFPALRSARANPAAILRGE